MNLPKPKTIHLSQDGINSYCKNVNGILTTEIPGRFDHPRLCNDCVSVIKKEREKRIEEYNNRPLFDKTYDWFSGLSSVGNSEMDLILYPCLILLTCGLIVPAKFLAKIVVTGLYPWKQLRDKRNKNVKYNI